MLSYDVFFCFPIDSHVLLFVHRQFLGQDPGFLFWLPVVRRCLNLSCLVNRLITLGDHIGFLEHEHIIQCIVEPLLLLLKLLYVFLHLTVFLLKSLSLHWSFGSLLDSLISTLLRPIKLSKRLLMIGHRLRFYWLRGSDGVLQVLEAFFLCSDYKSGVHFLLNAVLILEL